jgi:phosphatidylethanolamine/phosphatidyl-N-methylethanolamine N-methyltransferase
MEKRSKEDVTRKRYDRLAFWYDFLEAPMERIGFASWRPRILNRIQGPRVLEVGVGTGKNLPYYPQALAVDAIDISPRMLERARKRASDFNISVTFQEMDVQEPAFPDQVFDTIFATFVFCSVPDPVKGLRELRRVCKPGGRLLLMEHMRPGNPVLGFLFDRFNPMVVRMMGANINRRTLDNIRSAGWRIRSEERLLSDIVRLIEADP